MIPVGIALLLFGIETLPRWLGREPKEIRFGPPPRGAGEGVLICDYIDEETLETTATQSGIEPEPHETERGSSVVKDRSAGLTKSGVTGRFGRSKTEDERSKYQHRRDPNMLLSKTLDTLDRKGELTRFLADTPSIRLCGAAMLPRSHRDQADTYDCRTHKQTGGASVCPMPPLKRTAVDGAFYQVFSQTGLDIEGTRQRVAEQLSSQVREVEEQAARASREVEDLREQYGRVHRDYRAGVISGESFGKLNADIAEEREAAEAESKRLREQAAAVSKSAENLDAESETLRALAELQAQIADRTAEGEARGIEALRAAVASIFEVVYVSPGVPDYKWPFYLEPEVREELLEGIPKAALALPVPENNLLGRGLPE